MRKALRLVWLGSILFGLLAWGAVSWATGTYNVPGGKFKGTYRRVNLTPASYNSDDREVSATVVLSDTRGFTYGSISSTTFKIITADDSTGVLYYYTVVITPTVNYGTKTITWSFADWPVPSGETYAGIRIEGSYRDAVHDTTRNMATEFAASVGA